MSLSARITRHDVTRRTGRNFPPPAALTARSFDGDFERGDAGLGAVDGELLRDLGAHARRDAWPAALDLTGVDHVGDVDGEGAAVDVLAAVGDRDVVVPARRREVLDRARAVLGVLEERSFPFKAPC